MKSKLIIFVFVVLLSNSNYVFAHEGMKHDEGMESMDHAKGSMMGQQKGTETNSKAVEVGNKICPVSGDKIPVPGEKGTMGDEPVKYEYNGKIYNLCCKMCVKDFKKNPKKYSKIAEKKAAKEKTSKEGQQKHKIKHMHHDQ